MYGGVEVVDQLRADRRLRQHESYGRLRVVRVAIENRHERGIGGRIDVQLGDEAVEEAAQVREPLVAFAEELANLAVALIAQEPLGRVGEQELVSRLDRVAAALQLSARGFE